MPQKHAKHDKTITLRVGARHLFTTDEGKYVWWPALQQVTWVPRGCQLARGTWNLIKLDNTHRGAMRKALRLELEVQTAIPLAEL